jgi:hypothetical protein
VGGCGTSGSTKPIPSTPLTPDAPAAYQVTVTGSSGSLTNEVESKLTVNY